MSNENTENPAKKTGAEKVTEKIIAMINDPSGVPSWRKPWTPPPGPRYPENASTGKPFRGANAFLTAMSYPKQPALFATIRQWNAIGETLNKNAEEKLNMFVRKGEASLPILVPIFVKDEEKIGKDGEPEPKLIGVKSVPEFHFSQTHDGEKWFEQKYGSIPPPKFDMETIWPVLKERIKEIVPINEYIGDSAHYRPGSHEIFIPKPGQFASIAGFYETVLHELTHATERDDEKFQKAISQENMNDDDRKAFKELRAEIGAFMLAQTIGVPIEPLNMASYINGWALREFAGKHESMILKAANYAQNAVDQVCTPEFMEKLQDRRNACITVSDNVTPDKVNLSITPEGLDAGKRYTFTADPGHGWLVVPVKDLVSLGIVEDVSPYSYLSPRGGKAYLEEDADAPKFVAAYAAHYGLDEDALWKKIAESHHIDRPASCRNYDAFDPAVIPGFENMITKNKLEQLFSSDQAFGVEFVSPYTGERIPPNEVDAGKEAVSVFPDGSSAVVCTNYAVQVKNILADQEVKVMGFWTKDNPDCDIARENKVDGHDFALVNNRFLVDPWFSLVESDSKKPIVYDLKNPSDRSLAEQVYGKSDHWEESARNNLKESAPPVECQRTFGVRV